MSKPVRMLRMIFGLAFVVALIGWVSSRDALFRLAEVQVSAPSQDLEHELQNRLVGFLGQSLFSIRLSEVEGRCLQLPRIESVSIYRRWPDRLRLDVKTKQVVALRFHSGQLWLVGRDGSDIEPLTKPVVRPLMASMRNSLQGTSGELYSFLASMDEHESLGPLSIRQVSVIRWGADRGYLFELSQLGLQVEMGFGSFEWAWRRANFAYGELVSRGIYPEWMDASSRRRVIARAGGEEPANLQNFSNGLNSNKLGRRKANFAEQNPQVR